MNGYEQRLVSDKKEIRQRVVAVGERVRKAVETAVDSLLKFDHPSCARVILGDLPVNREVRAINKLCHAFIARHLPSAGHLRFVSSVLQMNIALERVGDYAVTIAREGVQLSAVPPEGLGEEIRELARNATDVLADALSAFATGDAELARQTRPHAKSSEVAFERLYRDLTRQAVPLPLPDAFSLLTVAHRLNRVSDQAKNVCEETLFELTGEMKPQRKYRILFVEARDTLVAPLAVALARKSFPESGTYESAGYQPGERLAPELTVLANELSLDLQGIAPSALPPDRNGLARYDVIVSLGASARRRLDDVPYTTAVLEWNVPKLADVAAEALPSRLRELSHVLSNEIHDLMTTLRGDGAN